MSEQKYHRITGLYLKDGQHGKFMSGKAKDGQRYFVFRNTRKKSDSEPDYVLSTDQAPERLDGWSG